MKFKLKEKKLIETTEKGKKMRWKVDENNV